MRVRVSGLARGRPIDSRRSASFMTLWAADSLSVFGGEFTLLALPLTAVFLLHAGPAQMGLLVALELLPYGLFSLHAGALLDRRRKLPLLRATAFSRSVVLLTIPLAAGMGWLRLEWLYAVTFVLSCHAVFVDLAYQAMVPHLVEHGGLVRANARLGMTESAAGIAGPGLGGLLVQVLGAPLALAADALAMFASGLLLCRLRVDEPAPAPRARGASMASDIRHGLAVVWNHAALRWTALLLALWQFLKHAFAALFVLFAVRELGLSAERVGVVASVTGLGFLFSSLALPWVTRRAGLGPTMLGGLALATLCWGMAALVHGVSTGSLVSLSFAMGGEGFGAGLFFLSFVALRQAAAPEDCRARVFASMRFISIVATPLGALAGGLLGEQLGLRATLILTATAGLALVAGATLWSPIRRIHALPSAAAG